MFQYAPSALSSRAPARLLAPSVVASSAVLYALCAARAYIWMVRPPPLGPPLLFSPGWWGGFFLSCFFGGLWSRAGASVLFQSLPLPGPPPLLAAAAAASPLPPPPWASLVHLWTYMELGREPLCSVPAFGPWFMIGLVRFSERCRDQTILCGHGLVDRLRPSWGNASPSVIHPKALPF